MRLNREMKAHLSKFITCIGIVVDLIGSKIL